MLHPHNKLSIVSVFFIYDKTIIEELSNLPKAIHLGTNRARLLNPGDRASYLISTIVKESIFFFCLSLF